MREIKFRGKKSREAGWAYGFYVGGVACDRHTIIFEDDECKYCEDEVIPETVGQYIGLKDKNGKEIYEGDIVICPVHEESVDYLQLEAGDKNHVTRTICIPDCYQEGLPEDCKVIGNIHDNPDLLGVTE